MVSHEKRPDAWRSQTGAVIETHDHEDNELARRSPMAHVAKFVDRDGRVVEEGTPVPRRKPDTPPPDVSESLAEPPGLTVAVDASTMPHRTGETEKLAEPPFVDSPRDVPAFVPHEPTTMLDAPTTKVDSAEALAAEPDFDRIEWSADRLAAVSDALRVDKRRHTADLMAGAHAGMCVGPVRGALQVVAARLVQRALLADAGVGEIDDPALADLLFELAGEVLVGVEPIRVASRDLASKLEERAREVAKALGKAEARGDTDSVAEHRGRLDELTSTTRALRRTTR